MVFMIGAVMVNFTCPRDWATGCPVICSYTVPGVSARAIPDEVKVRVRGLSEADCSP